MTKVLKQANRTWFAGELQQYLGKLRTAKDNFIQSRIDPPEGQSSSSGSNVFNFDPDSKEDEDAITLEQIAHQYLEIDSILNTVQSYVS